MIFPDWGEAPEVTSEETALPLFREWAVDWENRSFALRNGTFLQNNVSRRIDDFSSALYF